MLETIAVVLYSVFICSIIATMRFTIRRFEKDLLDLRAKVLLLEESNKTLDEYKKKVDVLMMKSGFRL